MTMDILFTLIFLSIPIFFVLFAKVINVSFFKIDIINFLLVSIFVFSFLGVFPLYFQLDEYRVELGVVDKFILIKVLLISFLASVSIVVGYFLASVCFFKGSFAKNDLVSASDNYAKLVVSFKPILMLVFIVGLLCYYLMTVPSIAIVELFNGASITDVNVSRSNMTNAFSGYGYFRLVLHNMSIFLSIYVFLIFLNNKSLKNILLFIASFMVTSFSLLMTTEKAPFAWFMISIFMAYCYVRYDEKLPIKETAVFIFIITVVLAVTYMLFMDVSDIFAGVWSVFSRAFSGSIQPAYHYLEIFPEKIDFLLGRSFPNPKGILPFEHYYLTQEVMKIVNPQDYENGIIGTMPTIFWGELYVNFSYVGVFLLSFVLGVYLCCVRSLVVKVKCQIAKATLLIMLVMHFKDLSVTSFSNYIIDLNLFVIFIIAIFLSKKQFNLLTCGGK